MHAHMPAFVCALWCVCILCVSVHVCAIVWIHSCMYVLSVSTHICVCVHAYSCMQASVPTCMYYDLYIPCVYVCVCTGAWEIYLFSQLDHVTSTLAGELGWKPWKSWGYSLESEGRTPSSSRSLCHFPWGLQLMVWGHSQYRGHLLHSKTTESSADNVFKNHHSSVKPLSSPMCGYHLHPWQTHPADGKRSALLPKAWDLHIHLPGNSAEWKGVWCFKNKQTKDSIVAGMPLSGTAFTYACNVQK